MRLLQELPVAPSFRRGAYRSIPLLCVAAWMFLVPGLSALAGDPVASDEWSRITLSGSPAGYVRTTVTLLDDGLIQTRIDTKMKMGRMGSSVSVSIEQTHLEDAEGTVIRLQQRSAMPGEKLATGVVRGDVLEISEDGEMGSRTSTMEWDPTCRGVDYWRREFMDWLPGKQPGDVFISRIFDMELGGATTVEQEVLEVSEEHVKLSSFLEVMPGLKQTVFANPDGSIERVEMTMLGMAFVTELCTKEEALEAYGSGGGMAPEVFASCVLRPDRPLPRPRSLDRVLFRLVAKDKTIPFPDFETARQRIVEEGDAEVLLEIRRIEPGEGPEVPHPGEAATAPNSTIQSDDPEIIALAERLGGTSEDPWTVARALERGVYEYIDKKSFGVAFATASEVCRDRSGDCSEHAVLLAAVARARGIPSRVAMGLTYVGGIFGGHAWTEVWIDGRWLALDATLGLGSVDAAHIRFGVSSLEGLGMGTQMYGALLGLANLDIFVLETEHGGVVQRHGEASVDAVPMEVDGRRLMSSIYGVAFEAPEGFTWDEDAPHWMSGLLAQAEGPGGLELRVSARAVNYDFDGEDLGAGGTGPAVRLKVDGRPALVGDRGGWTLQVLDGDTVFRFDLDTRDDDEALETLLEMAESITFDS